MNVFLPYADYQKSIECLDKRRCLKQVVEASQLIDGLLSRGSIRWTSHPASRMYKFNLSSLIDYYNKCLNHAKSFWKINFKKLTMIENSSIVIHPEWLGNEQFHSRMRARLLYKDFNWYSQFGWTEKPIDESQGYIWPIDKNFKLVI